MAEKQHISTVNYVAASKPAFFLSEVLPDLAKVGGARAVLHHFTEISGTLTHGEKNRRGF
jgi:hypothetical protein